MLLVLFNLCFVLPLAGIVAVLTFAGEGAARILVAGRNFLERRWPVVLAAVALIAGAVVILLGITGLAASRHNRVGRFFRGVHHRLLHP
jgi:hypothetical protein